MGAPPPPHDPKRSAWKDPKMNTTKKKNAKDESFLLICQRTQLLIVFMLLIYLTEPINSRITIMRKGRLAVVFLVQHFFKNTENAFLGKISSKNYYYHGRNPINCNFSKYRN